MIGVFPACFRWMEDLCSPRIEFLYALSIIVRYMPNMWTRITETNAEGFNKVVAIWKKLFYNEM